MTTDYDALFVCGRQHHFDALGLLTALEKVEQASGLPEDVAALKRGLWAFLQAYGLRDGHGSVLDKRLSSEEVL